MEKSKSSNLEENSDTTSQNIPSDTVSIYNSLLNANNKKVATGLEKGLTAEKPLPKFVNPLKPSMDRQGKIPNQAKMNRMYNLGMIFQLGLMGIWHRYKSDGSLHIPGKEGNWTEYENKIANAVNNILNLDHATTDNIYFAIWNEPNGDTFWPYPYPYDYQNHFMDTWEHAYNTIKAINPNAKIVGPAFSSLWWGVPSPNGAKMQDFLTEAKSRDVLPDLISWHYPGSKVIHQVNEVNQFLVNKKLILMEL
jgi:hypothetical protein